MVLVSELIHLWRNRWRNNKRDAFSHTSILRMVMPPCFYTVWSSALVFFSDGLLQYNRIHRHIPLARSCVNSPHSELKGTPNKRGNPFLSDPKNSSSHAGAINRMISQSSSWLTRLIDDQPIVNVRLSHSALALSILLASLVFLSHIV